MCRGLIYALSLGLLQLVFASTLLADVNEEKKAANKNDAPSLWQKMMVAQEAWGSQLLAVSQCYQEGEDAQIAAEKMLSGVYAFKDAPVTFRPDGGDVRIFFEQVKPTSWSRKNALTYFIGEAGKGHAKQNGLAMHAWSKIRFEVLSGNACHPAYMYAGGKYFLTDMKGQEYQGTWFFKYHMNEKQQIRINGHSVSRPKLSAAK